MNNRCIVSVATGEFYCKMQSRLEWYFVKAVDNIFREHINGNSKSLSPYNERGIDLVLWHDCLPSGSKPHLESPYGFKVHAIKSAYEKGYTSILWLDSPAYAVKEDISPIFEKIEKEGYYAMSHVDPMENYVSDLTISKFRTLDKHDIEGENLPSGSCYGFDLSHPIGKGIFNRLYEREADGQFAHASPHRHDETILALILIEAGLPIFFNDTLFQSDSTECVIKSGGEW